MASTSVKNYILYYKNKLDRCKDDEDMILETIHKLAKPPTVTAEIIQDTGILKCLHKLCKRKGKVADTALPLFNKWKLLMTIAMSEKEKVAISPPELERLNHLQGDQQAASRSSHPAQEKDPSIHLPHRSRDSHPDRALKRKDPFPPVAEQRRPTHHPHRERDPKHPVPQKDHPPPNTKPVNPPPDAKYGNPSLHRSSDSDSDRGSRHQPAKRNYLMDVKRDQEEGTSHYMADSAHGNPRNPKRDSEAMSQYLDSGHGNPRNPKKDLEGTSHYLDDLGYGSSIKLKRDQREAMSHYKGDSAHSNPRNPKRDLEISTHVADSGYGNPRNPKQDLDATSHWGNETDSKHQQSKKDYQVDSVHGNPRNPKKDEALSHWGKDFKSRKDPERDSTLSQQKDYLADSTHGNPRNPKTNEALSHWGSNYKSRKDAPDTDSTTKKDSLNPKKDLEATSYREYKLRKELEIDSTHSGSKYPSVQRDLFPIVEGDVVDGAGDLNRDSDSRYPPAKKDYFAAEADTTCPGSRSSEHNGVTNSQDSNHHMDIDSLSNPNLCIETSQAEKLNASDNDSEPATPTKRAKTLEPYYIEMREGMFRAVKNHASPFAGAGGLRYCELIHRDIVKGNSIYKRDREKFEEPKKFEPSFPFFPSSPKDASSDGEKNHSKNGPAEQQKTERSGRPRDEKSGGMYDMKRKSASPCKDRKATHHDSTSDHKLKMKKDALSPSHLSKPLNNVEAHQSNCDRNKKLLDSPETSAMQYISSKKDRRAVYSGKKAAQDISSLKSNCLRVLRKNLDYLRCPMNVPYETLHPILETLNPSQLSKIEEHNRYLMAYTNSLWKQHYNRDCRGQMIPKGDKEVMWKEEYNRVQEQQRKKLKNLTASINASTSKAKPDRQAKVVESYHDFGRRGTRTSEVPIPCSKSANVPSVSPAIGSRLSSSPNPKASSAPRTMLPVVSKPKEIKHSSAHKPVKKVTAPLMSKVKKSMAIVYRQK